MVWYDDREWWIDYAKTIGIFLVVFIHLIQTNFINIFGADKKFLLLGIVFFMPLFFFISGYLYKNIRPKMAVKKYFKRLIIPYIFFYFLGILVIIQQKGIYTNLNAMYSTIGKYLWGMVLIDPTLNSFNANGPIWFLLALFIVICLFSLMKTFIKKDKYIFIAILGLNAILYLLFILNINWVYLSIDSAILGIMFFYTGYLSRKHNIMSYFKNNNINIVLAIIFFVLTYLELVYNGALAFRAGAWSGNFILCYLGAFAGIILVIAISSILAKFKNKIIFLISINTLTIMGLDHFLRAYSSVFFKGSLKASYPLSTAVVNSIIVICISVIIALFLNKYVPVLIGNKGKTKSNIFQRAYLMIKNKERPRLGS